VSDRALATVDPKQLNPSNDYERRRVQQLLDARAQLGEAVLRQLASLPPIYRGRLPNGHELLLVHGCPVDPTEPMSQDMSDELLGKMVGPDRASLVLCGGSHVPFDRLVRRDSNGDPTTADSDSTADLVRVVNLGSVGEAPGSEGQDGLFAHATFVEFAADEISVQQFVVPLGKAA